MHDRGRVIVGLSGGVDSSVAALLLQQQGYQVEGLFMKNWTEDDTGDYCTAVEDLADAQAVTDCMKIPLHTVNFSSEYWDRVFAYFLDEYGAGRTPNPDVLCNREIKFNAFLEHAIDQLDASAIATGHYASVSHDSKSFQLLRAADEDKDQTYFLYMLGQKPLSHSLFPLGQLKKQQVRDMAEKTGFPNHKKKDSTGICFIGERKFPDFLQRFLPASPGNIEDSQGKIIGHHQGLMYYTLGQRQGLGIGGLRDASEAPWFVGAKDLKRNVLIAVQGHDHPMLMCSKLAAGQLHWVAGSPPTTPQQCQAKIRHRQSLQSCQISAQENDRYHIVFDRPQRAATPGQSIVFYHNNVCLGGGIIEETDINTNIG
ncbi:MAG: tRNA 2-thiouridine(34) synthase MnmA [Candidatus Thiodiazotropha sp. (ex Lucinoma aequizonata)]|nr:tRNA 2-thiouridine(34) synthase MnmA [Candidatus Thiodiazotropha sp. (ex Lucinoma aequizonata)]MCU7887773.1 tRNA 2-thiouridine(34) synthase MnmA [Candidatus Thiodiazotropha sp. (ex Lucinoma aequizonata)]MCU7896170.1 tRNA 2-thiouridine(34) synthase MnmA [Candidatus Thiodiazotropha sp. (ex Lucinoma aequizonata)]MCU7899327.1 tRNA 2-thiouridine(34) synthase MnmA [Candidatus Thiodiazotropha sp. (ex Lucinoma aequizonata)]MCU7903692.1 tRNA 2-thiouridine(34) synthase MnmA [Candidatus Thiodiazotropha